LFAEISALANDGSDRRLSISDGGATNRIEILYGAISNRLDFQVISNNIFQASGFGLLTETNLNKIALKYKQDDFALWINGIEVDVDSSGDTPIGLNTLQFADGGGFNIFYGNVKQIQYFDTALTDQELEQLTSL